MADSDMPIGFMAADLAPGDARSIEMDGRELELACIQSRDDPLLATAYERLWAEFGAVYEMEEREVIERRLGWHPALVLGDCWLRYQMILVRRRREFVAVRDHTALVIQRGGTARAVVHLSHVLVEPAWRRTGLAGWLRAWPIQTARACLEAAGFPPESPITLVAEMEHPDMEFPNRMIRLKAYEKAGFLKVDSGAVNYFQPDFRPTAEIDASGGARPLPFGLIVRRVGCESERFIRGAEVREIVESLYRMYGTSFREQDMAGVRQSLLAYPGDETEIPLVPPTG